MIFLTKATGAKVYVTTGQAVSTIYIQSSYGDWDGATTETFGTTNTAQTAATDTTVMDSPAVADHIRKLKSLFVRNGHASSSCDITVRHTDGTTVCDLKKVTLQAGQELHYVEGVGFYVFQATSGLFLKRTIYTSGSNSFTPLSQTNILMVTVVGGGGGGGASGTGNAGNNNAGGGGGGGAITIKRYAVSSGATYTATVGGGGAGGVAPSNNGTAGTLSSFTDGTTQINAAGGLGGVFGPAIAAAPQVAPGGASAAANANGDINGAGTCGSPGLRLAAAVAISGSGGSTAYGGGGGGVLNVNGTGAAGTGYGSGGAGGLNNSAGGAAGGAGSGGIIIIDEYS